MDLVMVSVFVAGIALLTLAGWLVAPAVGLLVAGLALVLVPALWVRGGGR